MRNAPNGFFVHDGFLYVTGRRWGRVNMETMAEKEMIKGLVSQNVENE
jgi:hypothetical protein